MVPHRRPPRPPGARSPCRNIADDELRRVRAHIEIESGAIYGGYGKVGLCEPRHTRHASGRASVPPAPHARQGSRHEAVESRRSRNRRTGAGPACGLAACRRPAIDRNERAGRRRAGAGRSRRRRGGDAPGVGASPRAGGWGRKPGRAGDRQRHLSGRQQAARPADQGRPRLCRRAQARRLRRDDRRGPEQAEAARRHRRLQDEDQAGIGRPVLFQRLRHSDRQAILRDPGRRPDLDRRRGAARRHQHRIDSRRHECRRRDREARHHRCGAAQPVRAPLPRLFGRPRLPGGAGRDAGDLLGGDRQGRQRIRKARTACSSASCSRRCAPPI